MQERRQQVNYCQLLEMNENGVNPRFEPGRLCDDAADDCLYVEICVEIGMRLVS
jgi:hypothetical protein